MVESRRDLYIRRKPKVILDKRLPIFDTLKVGAKGQFIADVVLKEIDVVANEDGNDVRVNGLLITTAEPVNEKTVRVTVNLK